MSTIDHRIRAVRNMPTATRLRSREVPGPGSYPASRAAVTLCSFTKDGKLWAHFKDRLPRVSPTSYSVGNYTIQSDYAANPAASFGSASRDIDVTKVPDWI